MSEPNSALSTFEWIPPSAGIAELEGEETLAERLQGLSEDRGLTAAEVVRRAARETHSWLCSEVRVDAGVGVALRHEHDVFMGAHGWRGPVAGFGASLAEVERTVPDDGQPNLREALATECSYWLETAATIAGVDRAGAEVDRAGAEVNWAGAGVDRAGAGADRPGMDAVPRIPDRSDCARPLLEGPSAVETGETILVHGWSETVARGLELAQARGLSPEVIVSEGGPDLGGRRLARRLVASGLTVRFVFDAALIDALRRADRVWLGTEAIGARAFLGRVGTRALLERARDLDVPAAILTTSDKLVPGGELELPVWAGDEPWHLWEGAPHDVFVESQSFEIVPHELVDTFATNLGVLGPAEFAVRALRLA